MTDDMTSKVPMRTPAPLPTRSAGRVSFLEGRAVTSVPFHVEDKLVQSSGPSGLSGPRFVRFNTLGQGQDLPPTSKVVTPPDKGTVSPLHIQRALPFPPELTVWEPPVADQLFAYDMAETESRVVTAMLIPVPPAEDGEERWEWRHIYGN